jgi:hypothetical protein
LSRPPLRRALVCLAASAGAAALAGGACAPRQGPADRVERLRAGYTAEVTGFVVDQPAAEAAATGEGEAELVAPQPPVSDVELDLSIRQDGPERLSGLTLEVALLDPAGQEKAHYRIWVDTPALQPGASGPLRYRLEDVPYVAGDRFAVEVRRQVPPGERGMYKEFPVAE